MGVGVTFVPEKRDTTFCPLPRFFWGLLLWGSLQLRTTLVRMPLSSWVYEWYDAKKVQVVTPQRVEEVAEWHLFSTNPSLSNPKNSLAQQIQSLWFYLQCWKSWLVQFWQYIAWICWCRAARAAFLPNSCVIDCKADLAYESSKIAEVEIVSPKMHP